MFWIVLDLLASFWIVKDLLGSFGGLWRSIEIVWDC